MKRFWVLMFSLIITAFFSIISAPSSRGNTEGNTKFFLLGDVLSGSSILKYDLAGFNAKVLPTVGASIFPAYTVSKSTYLGLDINASRGFKSNYNDYYYYGPLTNISIIPQFGIIFPPFKGGLFLFVQGGGGVFYGFNSNSNSGTCFSTEAETGFIISGWKTRRISIGYRHSFVNGYPIFETITFRLWVPIYLKNRQVDFQSQ